LPVVSKKEEFLPGTEPHSPATYSNSLTDSSNARVTVGSVGISVLHTSSAVLGPKGIVRFSLLGEYFSQGDFPVKTATDIRSGGTFAASFQPFTWGEVFLGYTAAANTNNRTAPNLIQALGDLTLGIKASREWVKGLWAGADLRLLTFSGVGNQSIDRFAVGFKPRLIAAYDFRTITPKLPAILHLNLGFTIDNSGGLLNTTKPNASEEFALSLNKYNRFNFALALEAPLPFATPFLEYSLGVPLGIPAAGLVGPDGLKVDASAAMPQSLGLGVKVTAIKDLTLMAAIDLGLARSVGLGVPATPPWNLLVGASFNIDPFQRGETKLVETVRERTVEKKVAEGAKTGKVEGTVVDADTNKPIPGVIVAMVGAGLPPVASDAPTGRFLTHELPAGPVKLHVSHDGYKEIEQELKLEPGKTSKIELKLQSEVKKSVVELTVASKKKPVNATVAFEGPVPQTAATNEANKEPVKVELAGGTYTVNVTADGYLAQTREVALGPSAVMSLAFDLVPAPKKTLVIFKDDKIEILQQVHFEFGKATILADSFSLLQQVVDAVVKNNVKRIRVEGHTDNKGDKAKNQKLSEDRARSVADYLIAQGIDKSRLESVGYGDTRPVAPNLTARGRELNRRVEFIIVER
jgi:OOP family OmpA-OmpF porin